MSTIKGSWNLKYGGILVRRGKPWLKACTNFLLETLRNFYILIFGGPTTLSSSIKVYSYAMAHDLHHRGIHCVDDIWDKAQIKFKLIMVDNEDYISLTSHILTNGEICLKI